ncbi:MAG: hypothetical protein H5T98_03810 [Syntrophomonadaceae bacterium]|nr:hypothetical protein [Syntrophomonadaceae bacterium]
MKKENFFFLIFVLAAAVITGSTLGIANSLIYIREQGEALKQEAAAQENSQEETAAEFSLYAALESEAPVPAAPSLPELMVITEAEKEEIQGMLTGLGMVEGADYNKFIMEFQKNNSIEPTGYLDSQTLQAIIKQATLQKAAEAAGY